MEPPNGHPCPECGAPRRPDRTPSCTCTHRVAEALRDTRTAQAAAAEDFDPLHIRPYVGIDAAAGGSATGEPTQGPEKREPPQGRENGAVSRGPAGADSALSPRADAPGSEHPAGAAEDAGPPPSATDATVPLRLADPDATTVLPASPGTSALPTPPAPATTELSVTDLRISDGAGASEEGPFEGGGPGGRPGRRRRAVLLAAAAGACVAVVTAAGYATGLFSYEAPSRDTALPEGTRAGVPDTPSSSAPATPPTGSAPTTPPAPAAPPPSPTATRSPSASPSPSAPSASPSPSRSATPSAPQTSATATGPGQAPPDNSRQNGGPTTLRLGDTGPEVSELQLRLRQLLLFNEDADGTFDDRVEDAVRTYQWSRGIQSDDLGVYDRETRTELESETKEP